MSGVCLQWEKKVQKVITIQVNLSIYQLWMAVMEMGEFGHERVEKSPLSEMSLASFLFSFPFSPYSKREKWRLLWESMPLPNE